MDEKRAARISALIHVPAFTELGEELAEAEARYWRRHIADIQAGREVDQRELDFMRGKFDAIKAILKQPERAEKIMERKRQAEEVQ